MANRYFFQYQNSYERELVYMHGQIQINVSNAVTSNNIVGLASAARTGAGQYTLVFTDSFHGGLKSATFTVQAAAAIDRVVQIRSWTPATKTLVIEELAGAVATDAGAAHAIHCDIAFINI